jgi:hypothetical protein
LKLTKKQSNKLRQIQAHLTRAQAYLMRPDVAGIAHETFNPNGATYTIGNPECCKVQRVNVMDKYIGSDITGVYTGLRELCDF